MEGSTQVVNLEKYGKGIAPLPEVGALFNLAGVQIVKQFKTLSPNGLSQTCFRHKVCVMPLSFYLFSTLILTRTPILTVIPTLFLS